MSKAFWEDDCPNCGESWLEDEVPKEYRCPTCGTVGYECCFPAGALTECLDCECEEDASDS